MSNTHSAFLGVFGIPSQAGAIYFYGASIPDPRVCIHDHPYLLNRLGFPACIRACWGPKGHHSAPSSWHILLEEKPQIRFGDPDSYSGSISSSLYVLRESLNFGCTALICGGSRILLSPPVTFTLIYSPPTERGYPMNNRVLLS